MGNSATSRIFYDGGGYNGGDGGIVFPTELKYYYKLNESSGDAVDFLAGYNFTQTGTVPSAAGIIGTSRGPMSAANYFSETTHETDFEKQTFLVEAFIKTTGSGANQDIFAHFNGTNNGYIFYMSSDNKVKVTYPAVTTDHVASTSTLNDGSWHYVVYANLVTSGVNNSRLYVDGVVNGQSTGVSFSTAGPLSVSPVNIGCNNVGARPFLGTLDDIAYWDLTSTAKTWADIEAIITSRWNGGAGKGYSRDP